IHEALLTNTPTTKRDIFYKDVPLFGTQTVVDELVTAVAATLEIPRGLMNVRASPKGIFCGSGLKIRLKKGERIHGNNNEGSLIPAIEDIAFLEVSDDVGWVLVIEKEAVFQTLCKSGLTMKPDCPGSGILITGKGYPDLATRGLTSRLSVMLPPTVPILALVDGDAYGLDILSVYKFGSRCTQYEGPGILTPRIEWMGIRASELMSCNIDRDNLIPLTRHDHKKALELLKRDITLLPVEWRKEITHMLYARRKAEIEILASLKIDSGASLDKYKPALDNPLITYVTGKLNGHVNNLYILEM
ncbi:hypothetical protein M422DRAFT_160634, partial [Sphaerobolus stellatus SS14]